MRASRGTGLGVMLLALWVVSGPSGASADSLRLLRGVPLDGASLSPDGKRVAYDVALLKDWPAPGRATISAGAMTVRNIAPPASRKVIGEGDHPQWSPVRDEIAFLVRGDLWVCEADGSSKRQIYSGNPGSSGTETGCTYVAEATWSANGEQLAFVLSGCSYWEPKSIWLVDRDGQEARELLGGIGYAHQLAWSPKADLLAFVETESDRAVKFPRSAIKLVDPKTGRVRELVAGRYPKPTVANDVSALAYTPDGRLIAAASGLRDHSWQSTLWEIPRDGTPRVFLTQEQLRNLGAALHGASIDSLAFAPHAPRMLLAEFRSHAMSDLWVVDLPKGLVGLEASQSGPKTRAKESKRVQKRTELKKEELGRWCFWGESRPTRNATRAPEAARFRA